MKEIKERIAEIEENMKAVWSEIGSVRRDMRELVGCPDYCSGSGKCGYCQCEKELDDLHEQYFQYSEELDQLKTLKQWGSEAD